MTETTDQLLQARFDAVAGSLSGGDWADVLRRADMTSTRRTEARSFPRPTWRRVVVTVAVAVALAVPALALSGVLDTLFGFSNQGTPVPNPSLDIVHALEVTSARPGSFVKLASSQGIAVYAARRKGGHRLCFYAGEEGSNVNVGGDCLAPRKFPSPSRPVWDKDMTGVYMNVPPVQVPGLPRGVFAIHYLVGVAADAVTSVQVLAGSDCHPVATAPVVNNVYIDVLKPMTGEDYIVAREAGGKVVWHERLGNAGAPSCGLG
jgi:hypothetical protein